MRIIAATDTHLLWWISLGMGLVVILVVIALMLLLLGFIADIGHGVTGLLQAARGLAANTQAIPKLATTAGAVEELKEEAHIHHEYLQSQVDR